MIPLFKGRASCVGKIMTNPKGKTNLEKYVEAKQSLESKEKQLSNFKDQECKSAKKLREQTIPSIKNQIKELNAIKDKTELSETCKQYLKEWIIEQKYQRTKYFSSKYTEKGIETEQLGFQTIQDVLFKGKFLAKNQKNFEDDYFTGTPDVIISDFVIDNKSSWDLFTFPLLEEEIPTDGYDYQGRVYLRLTNSENFLLCYTLNDTPLEIISDEIIRYKRNRNLIDITDQEAYNVAKNFIYTLNHLIEVKPFLFPLADVEDFIPIPLEKRLIYFQIEKELEVEEKMIKRVFECREWIYQNWDKI